MRRIVAVVAIAVVSSLLLGAVPEASALTKRPRVMVVGDSITYLSQKQISDALRHRFVAKVDALTGTPMSYWAPFLASHATAQSRLDWVVELGTDDDPGQWQSDFAREVGQLSGQRCVILVTVNTRYRSFGPAIDQAMQDAAAARPNFHVLDWGNIEFEQSGWLLPGGIHPTKAGSIELSHLERSALVADCPSS